MTNNGWERLGAAGGILFVILQIVSQSLIQIGGSEPPFNAPAQDIVEFFLSRNSQLFEVGGYMSILSSIAFGWFLGSLWSRLRRAEEEPAWLSLLSFGFGLVALTLVAIAGAGWTLAMFRLNEGIDPQIVRLLFDLGNFIFANIWVMLAGFLLATGVVTIRTGALPRWLGWSGVVIALGLLVARALWAGPAGIAFTPYVLFWLWLIATSIVLMVRRAVPA